MTSTPSAAILGAAAGGDDGALEILVRTYHDRVYRFGIYVCGDPFDAEDAVQEAFTKLADRPDVVRHRAAISWLMTVVKRFCLRRLIQQLQRKRVPLTECDATPEVLASTQLDAEAMIARGQLVDAVRRAISTLERPYREVLVMRDLEGLSGDEVCEALGLSTAAMKSRLHRARELVRLAIASDACCFLERAAHSPAGSDA